MYTKQTFLSRYVEYTCTPNRHSYIDVRCTFTPNRHSYLDMYDVHVNQTDILI